MLDTNVVSDLRRRSRPALQSWMATLNDRVCLSAVTVVELQFGISSISPRDASFAADLDRWLGALLQTSEVVPLEAEAARLLGRMQAIEAFKTIETQKARFGSDLAIAATAIAAGTPIGTLNLADFRLIATHFPALTVVDPLTTR